MAVNNLLDTSTVSLSDIIGNGKTYKVPPYQSDYSWEKNQWEDLWNDILAIRETGNLHYMGSIVYRLGNYTLLEEDKNRACESLPFQNKKEIFATSQYMLSTEIQSNTWSPNSIDIRQDRLANYATSIWRISQYD